MILINPIVIKASYDSEVIKPRKEIGIHAFSLQTKRNIKHLQDPFFHLNFKDKDKVGVLMNIGLMYKSEAPKFMTRYVIDFSYTKFGLESVDFIHNGSYASEGNSKGIEARYGFERKNKSNKRFQFSYSLDFVSSYRYHDLKIYARYYANTNYKVHLMSLGISPGLLFKFKISEKLSMNVEPRIYAFYAIPLTKESKTFTGNKFPCRNDYCPNIFLQPIRFFQLTYSL